MKLIILVTTFVVIVKSQKFQQEFPFPPKFQTPTPSFSSDSSVYLPPESQTPMPYFPMKNINKLPFQFLPPTYSKMPTAFPTSFPLIVSSSFAPNFDEDNDDDQDEEIEKQRFASPKPPPNKQVNNPTPQNVEKKDAMPKMISNHYQHPIDRVDVKYPSHFSFLNGPPATPLLNQSAASRRMIISSEIRKNDGSDQIKAASFQGQQYLPAPGVFISSTTEPAIPILRLSNEMDLDGSFSYEALGADQTHYVQHSRMENMGTDKEEQIVEGSYSYVGDNGQTYTVHYIADSNGYRASGDHLPVPPPIPEIIQRAVQYNLAEEARKPPNLKSWNEDSYDNNESEKNLRLIFSQPPRNLFTGRTPEAFSFGFLQGANAQNNLALAASSQQPMKVNSDQPKSNNQAISQPQPQVTFLASQGAQNPSAMHSPQPTSRTQPTEKTTMPQLMNYEAELREPDQEHNKGLWRWQYGINAANQANQESQKNSISRSFGEGDDVIINFSDMTPEQYTTMIKTQVLDHNTDGQRAPTRKDLHSTQFVSNQEIKNENNFVPKIIENDSNRPNINSLYFGTTPKSSIETFITNQPTISTENIISDIDNRYKINNLSDNTQAKTNEKNIRERKANSQYHGTQSKIISRNNFMPPSQTVTQSYNYEEGVSYEPIRIKPLHSETSTQPNVDYSNDYYRSSNKDSTNSNEYNINMKEEKESYSTVRNIKFTDFIQPNIMSESTENLKIIQDSTTTETSFEESLKDNIFLKNLLRPRNNEPRSEKKVTSEHEEQYSNINIEPKADKTSKIVQYQPKISNEIKTQKKKPLDIADILNFVTMKNHFESGKVRAKSKPTNHDFNQKIERQIPQDYLSIENEYVGDENRDEVNSNYRTLNQRQNDELRGLIKNYKVLHRNHNIRNTGLNNNRYLTDLLHPGKMSQSSLPPLGRAGPSTKSYLPPTYS